ncbi:MAG: hypothetical protein HOJ34_10830 [Kordiimonadaceae bacterium]|jgi:hypothetical protein|nr:hypothetical protein [Kordiimonadaceae bacterium]MBT6330265.1 hypothetical protein [Kordiimonadaceae bacterium]MBT7581376.1 hypothetical protein [Kordiimonadaceae bacterium]
MSNTANNLTDLTIMEITMKKIIFATLLMVFASTQVFAQTPSQGLPTTNIMVLVKMKSDVQRPENFGEVMQEEVRETVKLYLGGKISQWFFRGDGGGVVFILNATSIEEAKTAISALPLGQRGMVTADYIPLQPMAPLGALIAPPM